MVILIFKSRAQRIKTARICSKCSSDNEPKKIFTRDDRGNPLGFATTRKYVPQIASFSPSLHL